MKYMLLLRHTPDAGPAEGTPEFDAEMATRSVMASRCASDSVDHRSMN